MRLACAQETLMAIVEEHLRGRAEDRHSCRTGQLAAKCTRPRVSSDGMLILASILLIAAGWIVFQFLVTLVTLD
jgi:hypothetical protein